MKKRTIITALAAAVTGLSAAAIQLAADLPTAIVAEAASNGTYQYSVANGKVTIEKYLGSSTTPTIPSKIDNKPVVKIANQAFAVSVPRQSTPNPMNITSVTFQSPSYVTEIGDYAFYSAPLKKVVLPDTVTSIGFSAFCNCTQLKSLEIKGNCQIGEMAFDTCSAMTTVKINKNCTAGTSAFSDCTSLVYVNYASGNDTAAFTYQTDANGHQMPVLTANSAARKVIGNCFGTSYHIKFIDEYITALCNYVVKNETCSWDRTSWMPDAVKARMLYDWLILHCEYEDGVNQVHNDQNNNGGYASVFISYALNQRGEGVGEAVCEGFAKAYNMLLRAANIESYILRAGSAPGSNIGSHAWNLVKIGTHYYQCDATWDDGWTHSNPNVYFLNDFGTSYHFFLKSDTQMKNAHNGNSASDVFRSPTVESPIDTHPLLNQYNAATGRQGLKSNCYSNYGDANEDGILDNDYDLNGVYNNATDNTMRSLICQVFNLSYNEINNAYLPIWLKHMRNTNLKPIEFVQLVLGQH